MLAVPPSMAPWSNLSACCIKIGKVGQVRRHEGPRQGNGILAMLSDPGLSALEPAVQDVGSRIDRCTRPPTGEAHLGCQFAGESDHGISARHTKRLTVVSDRKLLLPPIDQALNNAQTFSDNFFFDFASAAEQRPGRQFHENLQTRASADQKTRRRTWSRGSRQKHHGDRSPPPGR